MQKKQGHVYLDYFTPMANKQNGLMEKYTYDGVHPNQAGYQVMGPLAVAAIKKSATTIVVLIPMSKGRNIAQSNWSFVFIFVSFGWSRKINPPLDEPLL